MQNYNEIWDMILGEMKKELSSSSITVWFNDLELRLLTDTVAVFVSPR